MKILKIGDLIAQSPIVQGGMGVGVSLSGLASAVANENGIGVISSAGLGILYKHLSSDFIESSTLGLKEELKKVREKTKGIIGVNIMVAMSNYADMVKVAIKEKVDIIFSGAGMPFELPGFLTKESNTKLVPIVSSGRAAKIISEKWSSKYNYLPDAIVVEGPKAGGHLGFKEENILDDNYSLDKLVKDVCAEMKIIEQKYDKFIPVIAAGGIYTGEDIYNMMQCGASGVQLGTRFVTTYECDVSMEFKQAYIDVEESGIKIIKSPVGMPGRVIENPFTIAINKGEYHQKKCPFKCIKTCDIENSTYCIILALYSAYKGNLDYGYAFAGSNAFRATKIESVHDVFVELENEYNATKKIDEERLKSV